jgi:hypothetical protein
MSKKVNVNYRKICQEYYGYTDEQMKNMDVHHIDGNRLNNDPKNLLLISPEEHAKLHEHEFVKWARTGSKKGNEVFIKRLKEKGPTDKEKEHWKKSGERAKKGLHRKPHSNETKITISEKKKKWYSDENNYHPLWGKTKYEVTSPEGEISIVQGGWKEWCLSKNINPSNLRLVALGKRTHTKGWKAKILND